MGTSNGNGSSKRVEVEERPLPVRLTEAELLDRGEQMADAEIAIEAFKEKRSILNGQINAESKRRGELAEVIESKLEQRSVRCHWQEDFQKNVWRLIRQDTGEQVDTRPMSAQDRQGALELAREADDDADDRIAAEAEADALDGDSAPKGPQPRMRVRKTALPVNHANGSSRPPPRRPKKAARKPVGKKAPLHANA